MRSQNHWAMAGLTLALGLNGFSLGKAPASQQPGAADLGQPAVAAVTIGQQRWMSRNVAAPTFRNGNEIPEITGAAEWAAASAAGQPARVAYANNEANAVRWGYLYNYAAVTDPRGLCPVGWRVPNDDDWRLLEAGLGGGPDAADALKATTGWAVDSGGSNSTGFAALPGGWRTQTGVFYLANRIAYFWSTSRSGRNSTAHMLFNERRSIFRIGYDIGMGQSLRCIAE